MFPVTNNLSNLLSKEDLSCSPAYLSSILQASDCSANLRSVMLSAAFNRSSKTFKSPDGFHRRNAIGAGLDVVFAYERDIDYNNLESEFKSLWEDQTRWKSDAVICRSGMSCLWVILLSVCRLLSLPTCNLCMWGEYFETRHLLDMFSTLGINTTINRSQHDFRENLRKNVWDVIYLEPVRYSDCMEALDLKQFLRSLIDSKNHEFPKPLFLIIDITLCGPIFPIAEILSHLFEFPNIVVIVYSSLLKLYQYGMELTNAGMIKLYVNQASHISVEKLAMYFRSSRMLTGTGLTLYETILLNNPLTRNLDFVRQYTHQILHNNSLLALSLSSNGIFRLVSSPVLKPTFKHKWQQSPFVILKLKDSAHSNYEYLQSVFIKLSRSNDYQFTYGSSFGFQHTRFETYYSGVTEDSICFKIAVGYHQDTSKRNKIITLISRISEICNFEEFMKQYPLKEHEILHLEPLPDKSLALNRIKIE